MTNCGGGILSIYKKIPIETFVIAIFLSTLDIAAVTPTLTAISDEFQLPYHWSIWVISLHLAFFSLSLPLFENWAAQIGRTKVFSVSLLLFIVGSCFVAFSDDWFWLMWGRVIEAVGAGGIVPFMAMQIRRMMKKGNKKTQRQMLIAFCFSLVFTPWLSALLVWTLHWRLVFLLYLPLSLLIWMIFKRWRSSDQPSRPKPVHGEGIFFFGGMIFFLMIAISSTNILHGLQAWLDPEVLPLWIIAFGLMVLLFMVERQSDQPFFEPHLFANGRFWLLYGQVALTGFSWMAIVLVPDWIHDSFQFHPILHGLFFSLILLCSVLVLPAVQRLAHRWSFKMISALGFFCAAIAYAVLGFAQDWWILLLTLLLLGIGLGLTLAAPVHLLLFEWLPSRQVKDGLMTLGMFRAAGGAVGLVVMARLYSSLHPCLIWWMVPDQGKEWWQMLPFNVMILAAITSFLGLLLTIILPIEKKRK